MESTPAHACPRCAAPTQTPQRWCLECGAELPQPRRSGLRPTVGIVTTLALLVGAASAGGYTLLAHDRPPPPPTMTVAAQPPPTTTAPVAPATEQPLALPPSSSSSFAPPKNGTGGASTAPRTTHTTPTVPNPGGSVQEAPHTTTTATTPAPKPQLALTNVALGTTAVVYAPYAADDVDLGDPSLVVDGTTRTGWKTPSFADPTVRPQLGVSVDLARVQKIRTLVLQTSTPGLRIEVYGARTGPPTTVTDPGWDHLATRGKLARKTRIALPQRAFRYLLVWIVGLPPGGTRAAISELSLLSLQPE